MPLVRKTQPRVDISNTCKRGKRLVFAPQIEEDIPRPKPRTRSQEKILPRELVGEETFQAETMR